MAAQHLPGLVSEEGEMRFWSWMAERQIGRDNAEAVAVQARRRLIKARADLGVATDLRASADKEVDRLRAKVRRLERAQEQVGR